MGVAEYRREVLMLLPWVTRYKKSPGRCEGYRWGQMPLKALYGPKATAEAKERYRCKHPAWWRFRGLKSCTFGGRNGKYCWSHLVGQMESMDEWERCQKWYKRHRDEVNELRVAHGLMRITTL